MARHVVVDTETTGLSTIKGRHRLIEIALVEVRPVKALNLATSNVTD